MKTLLVLRHAKSSWSDSALSDAERRLNKRGKRDAPRMGQLVRDERLTPELIISSTAKRAESTAKRVAKSCRYKGEIELDEALYLGGLPGYRTVQRIPDVIDCAMIIGHNPDMEALIEALTGRYKRMPTAALAQIELPIDHWRDLELTGTYRLVNLWRPKEIA